MRELYGFKEADSNFERICGLLSCGYYGRTLCKNITLSPSFVEAISPCTDIPIDVHLMVEYPDDYLDALARAGAGYLTPHAECINKDAFRMINKIRTLGCKVGVGLNPATPLSYIKPYLQSIDKLTIMTVDPGFAGQPFIPEMVQKVKEAKCLKEENGYNYLIEVDGACNEKTYKSLYEAGAEVFIMGSSGLFGLDENLEAAWHKMTEAFQRSTDIKAFA